jgi:hypothetical protein
MCKDKFRANPMTLFVYKHSSGLKMLTLCIADRSEGSHDRAGRFFKVDGFRRLAI